MTTKKLQMMEKMKNRVASARKVKIKSFNCTWKQCRIKATRAL